MVNAEGAVDVIVAVVIVMIINIPGETTTIVVVFSADNEVEQEVVKYPGDTLILGISLVFKPISSDAVIVSMADEKHLNNVNFQDPIQEKEKRICPFR